MRVLETGFPGLLIIEPAVFEDERGFFMESYNQAKLAEYGVDIVFIQDNHALSRQAGVLRGLHYQTPPMAQAKLVRVIRGRVLDVVADIREGSPTYGSCYSLELSAENKRQLLVPAGFAHGYVTLESDTEFVYKVDALYSREHDRGVRFDDPDLAAPWPAAPAGDGFILSEKDRGLPLWSETGPVFKYS